MVHTYSYWADKRHTFKILFVMCQRLSVRERLGDWEVWEPDLRDLTPDQSNNIPRSYVDQGQARGGLEVAYDHCDMMSQKLGINQNTPGKIRNKVSGRIFAEENYVMDAGHLGASLLPLIPSKERSSSKGIGS